MLFASLAVLFSASAEPGKVQAPVVFPPEPQCPEDVDNYREWMVHRSPASGKPEMLPKSSVYAVAAGHRKSAATLLQNVEWLELTVAEAKRLAGSAEIPPDVSLTPYLIRNIVPDLLGAYGQTVWIEHIRNSLRIRAALFGCGGFLKNPLIVFLSTPPDRVDIDVSAIW